MAKGPVVIIILFGAITGIILFQFIRIPVENHSAKVIKIIQKGETYHDRSFFIAVDQDTVYQLTGWDSFHITDSLYYHGKHILLISQLSMGTGVFASGYTFITVYRNGKITESRHIPHPNFPQLTLDEERGIIVLEFEGNENETPKHSVSGPFNNWPQIPTVTFEYNLKTDKVALTKGEDNWWM